MAVAGSKSPSMTPVTDLALGLVVVAATATALQAWLAADASWLGGSVLAYLALAGCVYRFWPRRRAAFGWPNRITLARAALVAVIAGALLLPGVLARHGSILAALAGVAILLDGLDGWLARALGSATRFGARFDMEVDALLILILSICVFITGQAGAWVLAIGAMRYAFVAAGWIAPWWQRELPPSRWRKIVCVTQGVVLAALLLPWLQPPVTQFVAGISLLLLACSFARDAAWLVGARELPLEHEARRSP